MATVRDILQSINNLQTGTPEADLLKAISFQTTVITAAGAVTVTAGSVTSGNGSGAAWTAKAGNGFGAGNGGLLSFIAGDTGATSGQAGNITFTGGNANFGTQKGGDIIFVPGFNNLTNVNGGLTKFSAGNTGSICLQINADGSVNIIAPFYPATPAAVSQTACSLYAGTGAPNNANGANGDIYFRSDGGALTTIYQRRAGAWVGIV
jgi:hypothetical protein